MTYTVPPKIAILCAKKDLSNQDEQEKVKKEVVKYLKSYLNLKEGKNSFADVTGIIRNVFMCNGTSYSFERDIAGRMMRTKDYTMIEAVNDGGGKEVYIVPADRDWWDKSKFWFTVSTLLLGTLIGSLGNPLSNLISSLTNKEKDKPIKYQIILPTSKSTLHPSDTLNILLLH
ncbi:MAG TPA: hypothetical protein VHB48_12535 [Chitinophagaceae bacterium]|nr:hypothetical protein [Chitinophagaceae bacterium]